MRCKYQFKLRCKYQFKLSQRQFSINKKFGLLVFELLCFIFHAPYLQFIEPRNTIANIVGWLQWWNYKQLPHFLGTLRSDTANQYSSKLLGVFNIFEFTIYVHVHFFSLKSNFNAFNLNIASIIDIYCDWNGLA